MQWGEKYAEWMSGMEEKLQQLQTTNERLSVTFRIFIPYL